METPTPDNLQESLERHSYRWYVLPRLSNGSFCLLSMGSITDGSLDAMIAHKSAHAIHGWHKAVKMADHSGLTGQLSTRICDEIAGIIW